MPRQLRPGCRANPMPGRWSPEACSRAPDRRGPRGVCAINHHRHVLPRQVRFGVSRRRVTARPRIRQHLRHGGLRARRSGSSRSSWPRLGPFRLVPPGCMARFWWPFSARSTLGSSVVRTLARCESGLPRILDVLAAAGDAPTAAQLPPGGGHDHRVAAQPGRRTSPVVACAAHLAVGDGPRHVAGRNRYRRGGRRRDGARSDPCRDRSSSAPLPCRCCRPSSRRSPRSAHSSTPR
jgi:hypothetical protein